MITTQRRASVALACTLVLAMAGPAAAVPAGVPIRIGGSLP